MPPAYYAQLTRDLFAIAKFLVSIQPGRVTRSIATGSGRVPGQFFYPVPAMPHSENTAY